MKQCLLLCVCAPAVFIKMDMYVPFELTLDELCEQAAQLIEHSSQARFVASVHNTMFRKQDGMCLCGDLRVCDIGLKNSEVCYIM